MTCCYNYQVSIFIPVVCEFVNEYSLHSILFIVEDDKMRALMFTGVLYQVIEKVRRMRFDDSTND